MIASHRAQIQILRPKLDFKASYGTQHAGTQKEIRDMMRRVSQAWCRPHPELTSLQHQACAILPSSPKVLAPFTLQFHLEHARAENPANPPLIGANILCSLPRTFNLAQESIQAYGKSLLIEIPRQALSVGVTFLQIQFYLPRHMLVIAETELLEIEHYWSQWSDKLRSRVHPHI